MIGSRRWLRIGRASVAPRAGGAFAQDQSAAVSPLMRGAPPRRADFSERRLTRIEGANR
jgi:hypothetical protein